MCYWVQLKLIILSSSQHILNTRYLFNEWCPNCTFASCSTQRKFATFRVIQYQDKMGKWYKKTKKLTFLLICDYWNAMQRIFIRFLTWRSKFKWCSLSLNMEKELFWWVNNKNDNVQRRTVSELFILFFGAVTQFLNAVSRSLKGPTSILSWKSNTLSFICAQRFRKKALWL